MKIYKFRPDMVFDCELEVSDGTTVIPRLHTFQSPPPIPEGSYAVMNGGWCIVEGTAPIYPLPIPPPTPEQIEEIITKSTQERLDTFAQTRNYDNILSACTYANSSIENFKNEGQYCVDKRDETWNVLYQIMADVLAGKRPLPASYEEIEPELPQLVWPS